MTMKYFLTLSVFAISLFSCSTSVKKRQNKGTALLSEGKIRSELTKMMDKEGPYTFVIIEEPESGKFVQFAGNKNEELLFDFPSEQLSKKEFELASKILLNYDIHHETSPTYTDESETTQNGTLSTFSKRIKNDVDLAVELTSKIMIDVFEFDENITLKIETD